VSVAQFLTATGVLIGELLCTLYHIDPVVLGRTEPVLLYDYPTSHSVGTQTYSDTLRVVQYGVMLVLVFTDVTDR
jgi:hypothetical protein